ncbi:MAG: hypothetical protein ACI82Q_002368 [Nonlabens sp.]|jgi:uncharacterized protein involved in exopolysaccharide biosynthesis
MEDEKSEVFGEDEIDVIAIVQTLWYWKKRVLLVAILFLFIGGGLAFTAPEEYESTSILIPEAITAQGQMGGSLGGLASLAGIDLTGVSSGTNTTINPELYRSVAQSTPFLIELMNHPFYFQGLMKELSILDYFSDYQKKGFVGTIIATPKRVVNWLKHFLKANSPKSQDESGVIRLTEMEKACADDLRDRVLVTMDWSLNVVTIEAEMQDPLVSAKVAEFTQNYITEYVTHYALLKSREQLLFVEKQFFQRKKEFEQIQIELAEFRDNNQFASTARAKSEEERLVSRYNLAFSIYNQLAKQVETIKLQLNENTPVFTVLEPVYVPLYKSKPRKMLVIIISSIVGILGGITYCLFQVYVLKKKSWQIEQV